MSILKEIADKTAERIALEKEGTDIHILLQQIEERKENENHVRSFLDAVRKDTMSFICEVKKASPFEGVLADKFPYLETAEEYEAAGADAVSCVTEPFYYEGSDQYLWEIAGRIHLPVLRKDFVIDEYMVYQARALGASAITLYCGILDDAQMKSLYQLSTSLSMDTVFEVRDEKELQRATDCDARIIGILNRDMESCEADITRSIRLRSLVPENTVVISEGGVRAPGDIRRIHEGGIRSVLIGEMMMRSTDKAKTLTQLRTAYE
ncbi:MAG: indole-3-glycerol phosphate synthase TrpC [Blautia sp.]|nr:indole-3-glycerol phosphate synthase TrpC [Blautia sp.]